MYKRSLKILVLLLFFAIISLPNSSLAFKSITRDQLVYDAIEFCPQELKEYLSSNLASVSSGIHFAERHRRRSFSIDPYEAEVIYHHLVKDLKEGKHDEFNTAHAFGVLACFISETISPDNPKTPQHLIPENVAYDGYHEITDIKSNVTSLIENYRIPCRRHMKKEISDALYNVAVNEIVDYWISAWEAGGYRTGLLASTGKKISHQNLVLNFKVVG
jgi:hypothetical protein